MTHALNPVSMLGYLAVVSVPLLLSLDLVTAGVTLVCELVLLGALVPWSRVTRPQLEAMALVLAVSVVMTSLATLLYGQPGGAMLVHFGPIQVSENSVALALTVALRIAALVIPACLLFASTSSLELADALILRARLPERFVLGAVAGMRMMELIADDLTVIRRARRARGVSSGVVRALLPLFVLSLRRASSLSTVMEARGFDGDMTRTHFRSSPFSWRDGALLVAGVLTATLAVVVAVALQSWRFIIA